MLQNAYLLAKIGADTAENEHALGTVAQWDRYVSRSIGSVLRAEDRAAGSRRDFAGVVPLAGTTQIYGPSQVFHSVAFFATKEYEKKKVL